MHEADKAYRAMCEAGSSELLRRVKGYLDRTAKPSAAPVVLVQNSDKDVIAQLDAISRQRALTLPESLLLERAIKHGEAGAAA